MLFFFWNQSEVSTFRRRPSSAFHARVVSFLPPNFSGSMDHLYCLILCTGSVFFLRSMTLLVQGKILTGSLACPGSRNVLCFLCPTLCAILTISTMPYIDVLLNTEQIPCSIFQFSSTHFKLNQSSQTQFFFRALDVLVSHSHFFSSLSEQFSVVVLPPVLSQPQFQSPPHSLFTGVCLYLHFHPSITAFLYCNCARCYLYRESTHTTVAWSNVSSATIKNRRLTIIKDRWYKRLGELWTCRVMV